MATGWKDCPDVLKDMKSLFDQQLDSGELYEIKGLEGSELGERERKKMHKAAVRAIQENHREIFESSVFGRKPAIDIDRLDIPRWDDEKEDYC